MAFFDTILKPLNAVLHSIDNSSFLKKPMTWLYIINGVIAALVPIIMLVYIFSEGKNIAGGLIGYVEGWSAVVWTLEEIILVVVLLCLAIYAFMFWLKRARQLDHTVRHGDAIVAIPVYAHFLQTGFEFWGLFAGVFLGIAGVLMFILQILTWPFYDFGQFLLQGIVTPVLFVVIGAIVGYFIIFLGHVFGELLRIKAIVGNNLRDLGDIFRATTMED